ncbi:2,3-dihydroxybenzoate-AMP ligase [Nocardioides immobilis]|uniref:2,3-dihydroxybenzoate-AMP ligase n=1 Tax=Nocardioides immobilis TaxID=2049295 RepID=A0A417Y7H7_9ACTN|nr:2,3-dihydroxybenzoate-AMP ligase [Nocardioides immobilis]
MPVGPVVVEPVSTGCVPWPEDEEREYRDRGWWAGVPIGSLPAQWARNAPPHPALIDGERSLSYAELAQQVEALAGGLAQLGLRGGDFGDRVLVHLPNGLEIVTMVLACTRLGVVPVLSLPSHGESELADLATRSQARALVVPRRHRGRDLAEMGARLVGDVPSLRHLLVAAPEPISEVPDYAVDLSQLASTSSEITGLAHPAPSAVALLLLSGGTTGTPKLIPRTHDDYVYNLRASGEACAWDSSTVFLASIPVAHNFGLGCPGVLGVLEAGGTAVLNPSPEPEAAFASMNKHGVTHAAAVPAVAQRWLDYAVSTGTDVPSLRVLQVGGARLAEEVARRLEPGLGVRLQQALGMAEGLINYTRLTDPPEVAWQTQGRPISPGDEVRVVDSEGADVPAGEVGELWTRGPYTIRGYWRAEEHNRRAFAPGGWYRSGDLVRVHPTGNLVVEGRLKDVINRAGEKISAEEIENIMYALPGVEQVAVVAAPDPELGEKIAAVVVTARDLPDLTIEAVAQHFEARKVARFKTPELLLVVPGLPLTKVGKIDKSEVRRMVAGQSPIGPDHSRTSRQGGDPAPLTDR